MIDHFSHGLVTPMLSFVLSCFGCAAGLSCTARARVSNGAQRNLWLCLGALAIGGTGIWVMHFVAMLGFTIAGAEIRYDIPLTLLSAALAVVVVGIGLFLIDRSGSRTPVVLAGGTIAGLGVAGMHYLGMRAMHVGVPIRYDPLIVLVSLLIAVVAASAGLWLALNVRSGILSAAATVVMGIAVSGMHYTGMAAMSVPGTHHDHIATPPTGLSASELLLPLIGAITLGTLVLLVIVTLSPTAREMRSEQAFEEWRARLAAAARPQPETQQDADSRGSSSWQRRSERG
jgi:NO-binding membrane sensor protein with MHYT domain